MQRYGRTLLLYTEFSRQLAKLEDAAERVRRKDPRGFASNSTVKLLRAVDRAIAQVIPQDPSRAEYQQGNTLGRGYRHWRRTRIGRRFRLFFRDDTKARVIIHAWMNDERMLRSAGSTTDPYTVFATMLAQGSPPDDWASLMAGLSQNTWSQHIRATSQS